MRFILGSVVVALVVGAMLLWTAGSPADPGVARTGESVGSATLPQVEADATPQVDQAVRTDAAAEPPSVEAAPTIRGRLVDAVAGTPITDGIVVLTPALAGDDRVAGYAGELPATGALRVQVDALGRFELRFAPHPVLRYDLLGDAPGCVPIAVRWPMLEAAVDLGDVPLRRARRLVGRLVDTDGAPVSGVEIEVAYRPDSVAAFANEAPLVAARTTTFADGGFAFPAPLPPGALSWHVVTRGFEVVLPGRFGADDTKENTVVRRLTDRIAGTVTGTDGRPIANARVRVQTRQPWGQAESRSDDRGAFVAFRGSLLGAAASIEVVDHALVDPPAGLAWGDLTVDLRVRTPGSLRLRVTDEQGEPVLRYRVIVRTQRGAIPARWEHPVGGRHPDGVAQLQGLPPGRHQLLIVPRGEVPAGPFSFEVLGGGIDSLTLAIGSERSLRIALVDVDGVPIANAAVALVLPSREGAVPPRPAPLATERTFQDGAAMRLTAEHTDSEGGVRLRAPSKLDDLFIHVSEEVPGFAVAVATLPVDADGTLRIVAPRAAELHVTIRDTARLRESLGPDLELLMSMHRTGEPLRYAALTRVRGDRATVLDGLTGHFELRLAWRTSIMPLTIWPDVVGLADVELGRCEATADATIVRPGRVFGVLTNHPPEGKKIDSIVVWRLQRTPTVARFELGRTGVTAGEHYDVRGLLPGTLSVGAMLRDALSPVPYPSVLVESLELAPGATSELDLQFR